MCLGRNDHKTLERGLPLEVANSLLMKYQQVKPHKHCNEDEDEGDEEENEEIKEGVDSIL